MAHRLAIPPAIAPTTKNTAARTCGLIRAKCKVIRLEFCLPSGRDFAARRDEFMAARSLLWPQIHSSESDSPLALRGGRKSYGTDSIGLTGRQHATDRRFLKLACGGK